jgi:outer membrane protein assembly factor BamB
MRKFLPILIVLLLLSPVVTLHSIKSAGESPTGPVAVERYGNGYRYNARGWIYLHIEGEPYERGFQHGYLLAPEITDLITRWSNVIHNSPALRKIKIDHNSSRYEKISNAWWNFIRSQTKRIFWNRIPDEYKKEIEGIADGVKARGYKVHGRDVDYVDILASNEMYEFMTRLLNPIKGFHPLKSLFNILRKFVPTGLGDEKSFINALLTAPPAHHCNGFIATGDATTHGQIVAAHGIRCGGWWYSYYIAQRWNVVIDIVPSQGYRLVMVSAPGYIWSDDNYYQNENGIVFMDTTCMQGPWTNRGYPMSIRTRMTAQYSSSVDEAIDYLLYKNDGVWTAAYLIGDTKTGEIARLDLGLYKYEVWRTFNGFYWTANNLMSKAVRAEATGLGLQGFVLKVINKLTGIPTHYEYFTRRYYPAPRDLKFEELGKRYYGKIDIEVLKNKIMTGYPVCDNASTDVKAADTQLIENNSIWVFWGNVRGMVWNTSALKSNLAGVKDVPPAGWTLLCGLPAGHDVNLPSSNSNEENQESRVIWSYDFAGDFEGRNFWYADLALVDDVIYGAGSDGAVYALEAKTGDKLWSKKVNSFGGRTWINADNDVVVVGWENESCALDSSTGNILWRNNRARFVSSQPVFVDDMIIVGSRNGDVYALDRDDGSIRWHTNLGSQKVYVSLDESNDRIVAAGENCYSMDASDGSIDWTFSTDGLITSAPLIAKDTIYFGSSDTSVYALEAKNGALKWKVDTGWGISCTPAFADNMVFVASMDHHLYAFDADNGEMIWSFSCNAAIHSPPTAYGDYVFFGCDDGRFYAVNKTNGELAWCFAPGYTINDDIYNYITTAVVGNSVAYDGMIFVSANGMIYGLDAQTFEKIPAVKYEKKTPDLYPYSTHIAIAIIIIAVLIILYLYVSKKRIIV